MDSFSFELKKEVAKIAPVGTDEALSELSAIIKTCGEITKNGKNLKLSIRTELEDVSTLVEDIVKQIYGQTVQKKHIKSAYSKNRRFELVLTNDVSSRILIDTEILSYDKDKYLNLSSGISEYFVQEESLELAFLRGIFVGAFSCNISLDNQNSHSSGYHAEFVFSNQTLAQDFCFLLADFDIISKMTPRNSNFVVYVKGLDMVSDLLALVGASQGVLKLQNEGALRSIRNNINRQNNCISANLTKTVDASIRELDAINLIRKTIGIETLAEPLQEVCNLRLANPEESLDELVKLSSNKISKSGMYHRFKKIEEIASKIKDKTEG